MRLRPAVRILTALCSLALAATVTPSATAAAAHGHHDSYRRVAYFTQWGVYGRDYQVKDLQTAGTAARLTHLDYAFGNIGKDGKCFEADVPGEGDTWADYGRPLGADDSVDGTADTGDQPLAGNFNQIRELKAKNPRLKAMLSLGGWSWSTNFSDAARTPASRKALVASCVDLFIKGDLPALNGRGGPGSAAGVFDGIDLDWEWPASPGDTDTVYRPEDKQNFTALVAEFRRQLDAYGRTAHRHYELSAFLPANPKNIDAGYEVPRIFRDLDFATLQGYDFHGTWEPLTDQQSALYSPKDSPQPEFSVDQTVRDWTGRGAPSRKLVVGVPFYGHGWTGVTGGRDGLYGTATGPAPATFEPGTEDYKALKGLAASGAYTVHRDRQSGAAWLFDGTTFWTYDDPWVLHRKTEYIRDHRIGGAMAWSLDGDTPDGELYRTLDRGLSG
jgi:chitinase